MIKNLPQDFINAMDNTSRKPVQLIEFILTNEIYYLSDRAIGTEHGLKNNYNPWIESWGTLRDNTSLTSLFEGDSLEIRSGTLTILSSPVSRSFVNKLFQHGIENIVVNLYQWFVGMSSDPILIDSMVCQDPIKHSESSMLLQIDIVSVLMKTDPYLVEKPAGSPGYPVVIGKADRLPLINLQTARVSEVAQYFDSTYLGDVYILNGIGFPSSGTMSIDSEDVSYSAITASKITITARGQNGTTARPHYNGATMLPYGALYDYAVCSGPVLSVDELLANGDPYENDVVFFPGQNPVIARFVGRPPWLKVVAGQVGIKIQPEAETISQFGLSTERTAGQTARLPLQPDAINQSVSNAHMNMVYWHDVGYKSNLVSSEMPTNYGNAASQVSDPSKLTTYTQADNLDSRIHTNPFYNDDPYTNNGVVGGLDHQIGPFPFSSGELDSVVIEFTARNSPIRGSDGKLEIFFIDINEEEYLLYTNQWWTKGIIGVDGSFTTFFLWVHGSPFSFDVTSLVNNLAELQQCKVRFKVTNTELDRQPATNYPKISVWYYTPKWRIGVIIPDGAPPQPYQSLVSKFDRDLSGLGALTGVTATVKFSSIHPSATALFKVISNNGILWEDTTTHQVNHDVTYDLGSMSWLELQELTVGVYHQLLDGDPFYAWVCNTSFSHVEFNITYLPAEVGTPNEETVVYAESLSVSVTSLLGADPTPPKVLKNLLETLSEVVIDETDFNNAHNEYDAIGYYVNGVIEANTRLHEALRIVLREGLCRFLFNQGVVRLITYFEETDLQTDSDISLDNVQLRSRKTDNQPTNIVTNDITVSYAKDYSLDVYENSINVEDITSLSRFSKRSYKRDLTLIDKESSAQLHADRLLALRAYPVSIYSFKMFMSAYALEKGDRVSIKTFLDPRFSSTGNILTIDRQFGKGKAGQINLFNVSIANPESTASLDLNDIMTVNDSSLSVLKGLILSDVVIINDDVFEFKAVFNLPTQTAGIKETFSTELCELNGYGTCGYGVHGYGN